MKSLAIQYFDWIIKGVSDVFNLTSRQLVLWKSQCGNNQDWLFSIPMPALQQTMNGRMYNTILRYKLGIAMFDGAKIFPACGKAVIDRWGRPRGPLCYEIGVKQRHDGVSDAVYDLCRRDGISSQREMDVGIVDCEGKQLRPTDLMVYGWTNGRDTCIDFVGSSPFTGDIDRFVVEKCVSNAAVRKNREYNILCQSKHYYKIEFT